MIKDKTFKECGNWDSREDVFMVFLMLNNIARCPNCYYEPGDFSEEYIVSY